MTFKTLVILYLQEVYIILKNCSC